MQSEQRGRDRQDLKELAKLASGSGSVPPPPRGRTTATAESSGFIDLAALQAADKDWLSKAIANGSPLQASAVSTLGGAAVGGSIGSYDGVVNAPSAAPPPLRLEAPSAALLAAGSKREAAPRRAWLYAGGALVLVAGAGFLFRSARTGDGHEAPAAAVIAPAAESARAAAKAVEAPAPLAEPPAAPEVAAAEPAPPVPAGAAAEASPGLVAVNPKRAGGHAHAATHAQSAPEEDAPVPAPSKKIPAFAAAAAGVSTPAPATPAAGGALAQALKSAVGPAGQAAAMPTKVVAAAPASNANVPDRPPAPAVTSAIRDALPAARGCMKTGDPENRVVLTFASNGSVSGVQASGTSAACIKRALGAVKVPAFSQPSYTAAVTVRPN